MSPPPRLMTSPLMRPYWLLLAAGFLLPACSSTEGPGPDTPATAKRAEPAGHTEAPFQPPQAPILYQPQFLWDDASLTRQGTGFFTKAPDGRVAAVSSVHYLQSGDYPIYEASFLTVDAEEPIATFTRHWGPPGDGGSLQPADLTGDYLLMPASEGMIPDKSILTLDERPEGPARGERVWLAVKDLEAEHGYRTEPGVVAMSRDKFIVVAPDTSLPLASLNGAPVISQQTGGVIGTLSRGAKRESESDLLVLTPASAIRQALRRAERFPSLEQAFTERTAASKESRRDDEAG